MEEVDDEERPAKGAKGKNLAREFEFPEAHREKIEQELSKGEKIIRAGSPAKRVVFVRTLYYPFLGLIALCASLVFAFTFFFTKSLPVLFVSGGLLISATCMVLAPLLPSVDGRPHVLSAD